MYLGDSNDENNIEMFYSFNIMDSRRYCQGRLNQ